MDNRESFSRNEAFAAQGVTLANPQRSWSGIREEDGAVVIAIAEADVCTDLHGSSCLLWAPAAARAVARVDGCWKKERLVHCRLAALQGGADGLLVRGVAAEVERGAVLVLRVENRHGEYWAFWGTAAQAAGMAQAAMPMRQAACLAG